MPSTGAGTGSCDGCQVSTNGTSSPAVELELGDRGQVARRGSAGRGSRCTASGPGDRGQAAVVGAPHPRHDAAEVEAQHELHPHRDAALQAADDAHDVGRLVADRHGVDEPGARRRRCGSRSRAPACPGGSAARSARTSPPARAASARATRRRAARRSRPASRSAAGRASRSSRPADERGGLGVADQRVVLDGQRHPRRAYPRTARPDVASRSRWPHERQFVGNTGGVGGRPRSMDALIIGPPAGSPTPSCAGCAGAGCRVLRAIAADAADGERAAGCSRRRAGRRW